MSLQSICVFCGASLGHDPAYQQAAEALGRTLAERGLRLIYGGGEVGLMGKLLRERKAQMPTYKKGNELGAPEGSSVPWPDQVKKGGN